MTAYSTRLFSMPSFIEGIARILDFGSTLEVYNQSPTPQHADVEALLSDWMAIGEDMTRAIQDVTMEGSSTDDQPTKGWEQAAAEVSAKAVQQHD